MANIYFKFTPEAKPITDGSENFYTPSHQILTQTLPDDVTYIEFKGNVWMFTYSTTPKSEVMDLARWLSRFQTKILDKTEVEAIFDGVYTKDWAEYIIVPADAEDGIQEERHTVDTFNYITVKIPLASFADFATVATQVTVMFSWVVRNVVGANVEFTKIEWDNPSLWLFLTQELITNIENAWGEVLWL